MIPFVLLVLSWVFYGNTLYNGYNLDDTLVTQNHPLTSQGVAAIPRIFKSPYYFDEAGYAFDYRPVVTSSFAIEHSLFGEQPLVSHTINVLLYGLTVILLFFLLRLFMPESGNRKLWFPGIVGLLFLIHPIHSEVVNSIKNRDELLALLFGLLASYLVVYGKNQPRNWAWYALGVGVFTLGLLAKLSGLLFAILIPLSLILFRKTNWKEVALLSLPLTVVSLVLLPPLTPFTLVLAGGGVFLGPLAVLFLQQAPVLSKYLNGKLSLGGKEEHYTPLHLLCLALLLLVVIWWLMYPWSSVALISLWTLMGVSLMIFSNQKGLRWLLLGVHGLLAVLVVQTGYDYLLILGSLYGLFFLFSHEGQPKKIWWAYGCWSILVGVYYLIGGEAAILFPPLLITLFLWMGTSPRMNKGQYWAMSICVILAIGLGYSQIYTAAALFLLNAGFLGLHDRPKWKAQAFPISAGFIAIIGLALLLSMQLAPFVPMVDQQPTVEAIQMPEKIDDRVGRALEFSENPLPYLDQSKRLATSLNITKQYLQLLAWPTPLRFYYGYNMIPIADEADGKPWIAMLLLLIIVGLVFFAIPKDPWIVWGGILLLFSLALFSNYIIPLPGIVGERFMYIGSLGFILMIVRLFEWGISKWKLAGIINLQRLGAVFLLFVIVGTATYVVQRNRDWKDALTLFKHDITYLAQSAKANQLLALELLKKVPATSDVQQQNRLLEEAAAYFHACITIYPDFPYAYFDLGTTLMKLGKYEEAQLATEKSAAVDVYNPQVKFQLGMIHELKEEWDLAVDAYRAAIAQEPDLHEAYLNLSTLFFKRGNFEEGLEVSFAALERWPNSVDLLTNIGNVYAGNNAYTEAAIYFVRAFQQSPDNRELLQKIIYCYQQINRPDLAEPYLQMLQ